MTRLGLLLVAVALLSGCKFKIPAKEEKPDAPKPAVEQPAAAKSEPPKAGQGAGLSIDPAAIRPGSKFKVRFSGVPGNKQDWITVVSSKAPKETYGEWFYLNEKKEGEVEFTTPTEPGPYDIRIYYNWPDGGYEIQQSIQFLVSASAAGQAAATIPAADTPTSPPAIESKIIKPAAPQPRAPVAVPEKYEINGKAFTNDTLLSATPQTPPITLDLKDQPAETVLSEMAQQTGHQIKWSGSGSESKNLTLSVKDAPLWAVLASVCEQGGWGFAVYSQPGHPIGVPTSLSHPLRGHQVNGPVLMAWEGMVENDEFDFSQSPPKSIKVMTMILRLKMDPNSNVEVQEPVLNPDFSFTLADGKTVVLKADKEMQDGAGGRAWMFRPKEELSGKTATLETSITVWAPTQSRSGRVAWKQAETAQVEGVNITLTSVQEPDAQKKVNAAFTIGYDKSVLDADQKEWADLQAKIKGEQRDATPEEIKKLNALLGGGRVLAVTAAELIGKDGSHVKGDVRFSMGSPWMGYNHTAAFEAPDGFEPDALALQWSGANQPIPLHFKLENLPLTRE